MLGDDEDVFDSVTWESPATHAFDIDEHIPTGPGFRQSTADNDSGPLDPKWEGYLITSVKDPVKELAETKDAYVSYLVQARVRYFIILWPSLSPASRQTSRSSLLQIPLLDGASKTLFFSGKTL
jgi:sorting nexin-4